MIGRSAAERNLRLLAIATGFGTIIFTLLALPAIIDQAPYVQQFVYAPLTVLFCTLPVLLAPLGRWARVRTIRAVARVHTVVAGLFLVLWAVAIVAVPLTGDRGPWLLDVFASAAATAVIAWPPTVVWAYVVLSAVGGGVLRYLTEGNGNALLAVQDGVSSGAFCLFIAGLLMVTLRAGREQDAALEVALADARSAAEVESRARQRARFGSFVHDDVITSLLAAARATSSSPAIRGSAQRALTRLDTFVAVGPADGRLSSDAFEVELRSAASEIVDGVRFSGSLAAFGGVIPSPAAVAITGALGEAIRNSLRHAGQNVARVVHVTATEHAIVIEASDDGRGFDPSRIAPERLGIRTSILGRMAAVTGGSALVTSAPGGGTRVTLSWSAV
ncbi:MAG: ATP-binding protein [Rhodoglobus sp.]